MSKDVSLWFARNKNDEIVTIDNINKNDNKQYYCPLCGSELIPKQGNIMSWHFAHVDKSKCTIESAYHFWIKNELFKVNEKFKIYTNVEKEYICKEVLVEQSYKVKNKKYTPDITILTKCGERIFIEINHSNKKIFNKYIDIWTELNNTVLEIETESIIKSSCNKTFEAIYYNGIIDIEEFDEIYKSTIGKFKDEFSKHKKYSDKVEDLKYLDWFWRDLVAYENKDIEIDKLLDSMYVLNNHFIRVAESVLRKSKCVNIFAEISKYQKSEVERIAYEKIKEFDDCKFLKLKKPSILKMINTSGYYNIPTFNKNTLDRLCESKTQEVLRTINAKALEQKKEFLDSSKEVHDFISQYNLDLKNRYKERFDIEFYDGCVHFYYGCILIDWIDTSKLYNDFMYGDYVKKSKLLDGKFSFYYSKLIENGVLDSFEKSLSKINDELSNSKIFIYAHVEDSKNISCEIIDELREDAPKLMFKIKPRTIKVKNNLVYSKYGSSKSIETNLDFDYYDFLKNCVIETYKERNYSYCKCGNYVHKDNKEVWFFMNKGFNTPKLCYDCRQKRKQKGGQ